MYPKKGQKLGYSELDLKYNFGEIGFNSLPMVNEQCKKIAALSFLFRWIHSITIELVVHRKVTVANKIVHR